jgi:hypothetical protein
MTIDLKLTKKEQALLDRNYAVERLLTHYVREGSIVYTVLRSVSSSGMTRAISLLVANGDKVEDITYYAAHALGSKLVERNGSRAISVHGCGMDMVFHLVYNLSSVLFHGQDRAGYVLNQRWI